MKSVSSKVFMIILGFAKSDLMPPVTEKPVPRRLILEQLKSSNLQEQNTIFIPGMPGDNNNDLVLNVPTTVKVITTTSQPYSPTPESTTGIHSCAKKPDGLYPDTQHLCVGAFFMCSGGHSYLMKCPANLKFHPVNNVCSYKFQVAGCQ